LAFNSCWWVLAIENCADAGHFRVNNGSSFGVDSQTKNGAAFISRGAKQIYVSSSTFNRSAVGSGNGGAKGSVMIEQAHGETSTGTHPVWGHSIDVDFNSSNDIYAGSLHHGVRFDDSALGNIHIAGNDIWYDPPGYNGMRATTQTNQCQIFNEDSNTFHPHNNTYNKVGLGGC
jgi:hypothetical protein